MMKGKRSSDRRMKSTDRHRQRVGARHRQVDMAAGGVGYLDIYTKLESPIQKNRARDPRILQLKRMGMDWRWITIAEQIGFDSFIKTWRLISNLFEDDRSYVRASIPHVKKLIRFQRDMLIRQLHADGMSVRDISSAIHKTYHISMAHRTIREVIYTVK